MAKKKLLLNESVTRRFMKLAEIKPTYVSNFLREQDEEVGEEDADMALEKEEEEVDDMEDMEGMEDDMEGMEDDMEEEGGEEVEDLARDLVSNALGPWLADKGVEIKLGGEEDMEVEDEEMEDMEVEDEEEDMEVEDEEEDMDLEAPAEEAPAARGYMQEARRALRRANVSVINENDIISRVVNRVAKRLLKESQQAKKPARRNIRRRRR